MAFAWTLLLGRFLLRSKLLGLFGTKAVHSGGSSGRSSCDTVLVSLVRKVKKVLPYEEG